jgi:rhamnose transport system permease protein
VTSDMSTQTAPPSSGATVASSPDRRQSPWKALLRWETVLVFLLIGSIIYGSSESSNFFQTSNIFYIGLNMGEIAIMALPVTLIVITGEIDLSIAAMLGLGSSLLGYLYVDEHWSMWLCIVAVLVVGIVGGALNGILVTKLGLPSIAVTIGTLTLFRGIAEVIPGGVSGLTGFPTSLTTKIGGKPIPSTELSYSFGIFLVLAVIFWIVLQATPLGRSIFAIGLQAEAARFSGIRVDRIKLSLYILAGFLSAFAGILMTFRFASARYDNGLGLELNVVAIVLFGGVSIFGGRGSIIGVVLAVCIVGSIQEALTLINVSAPVQNIVTGVLLLLSVVIPNSAAIYRRIVH